MKRQFFILFFFTLYSSLFTLFPASAATITLPATGQTKCYDSAGTEISCAGTGHDGDKRMGVTMDDAGRFTSNGNGTITDNLTGLIWLQNANCTDTIGGIVKSSGTLTWAGSLTWSNNLASGSCSLSDGSTAGQWRLPTLSELESLINWEVANSAAWLGSQGFANVQAKNYWSSSSSAHDSRGAWSVNVYDGDVYSYNKLADFSVWPVRGGL